MFISLGARPVRRFGYDLNAEKEPKLRPRRKDCARRVCLSQGLSQPTGITFVPWHRERHRHPLKAICEGHFARGETGVSGVSINMRGQTCLTRFGLSRQTCLILALRL